MWSYHLQSLLLLGFETKVPRRHAKVEPFDLFFSVQIRIPHSYMKAKAPCIERWPPAHTLTLFVLVSPPMTMKYCTNQLHPA